MMNDATHIFDLKKLNSAQYNAATHNEGPAVVYAGAGSGKTRVICSRISWLILEKNVPSSQIIAVTFTNKAAKEMKTRIEQFIGPMRAKNVIVSTFHSFCAKFLRIYAQDAGFDPAFSIYDDGDQKSLLKDILKQLNVPDKLLSVATVKSKIDKIKNQGLTPEEYLNQLRTDAEIASREKKYSMRSFGEQYDPELIQKVYEYYQKKLKQQNAMDFNDLLLVMYTVLHEKPAVLKSMQNRFRYFLIDEFQDTNPIQFKLINLLSSHTKNLFIVGDDDQSIYSWRGAEPSFILNFHKLFDSAKTYKLEQNYRSTHTIVQAAGGIIKNNRNRADKTLFTQSNSSVKIKIKPCDDAHTESHYIANQIYSEVKNGEKFSDFCILYRTNAQSRSLEDELRRRMIPYVIYGSVRFYERAEIKILLAYLKLLVNPSDDAAFCKVVNTPRRGFGETALERLKEVAYSRNESLLSTTSELVFGGIENCVCRSLAAVKTFIMNFQKWKTDIQFYNKPSRVLGEIISDIGFKEYLHTTHPEDFDERWLNIIELKNAVTEFENEEREGDILSQFIEQAMLTVEPSVFNVEHGQSNAVTLMTIHSAKGLEFPNVFIGGLEEGILPHQNSIDSFDAVEEERRLMYVAVTRAEKNLTLTYSKRNRYKEFLPAQESRFISEIPFECVEWVEPLKKEFLKRDFQKSAPTAFSDNKFASEKNEPCPWRTGGRVAHKVFGEGVICGIENSSAGYKLRVRFHGGGEKTLIHTYVTAI